MFGGRCGERFTFDGEILEFVVFFELGRGFRSGGGRRLVCGGGGGAGAGGGFGGLGCGGSGHFGILGGGVALVFDLGEVAVMVVVVVVCLENV